MRSGIPRRLAPVLLFLPATAASAYCDSEHGLGAVSLPSAIRIDGTGSETQCTLVPPDRKIAGTFCGVVNPASGLERCAYQRECSTVLPSGEQVRSGFIHVAETPQEFGKVVCVEFLTSAARLQWTFIIETESAGPAQ